ncbi:protein dead ringer isoform X2 [Nymphalis io]|uniref:protein dead ringer isoform X2 n=1 Tax=Inachis io TaxID=171585 RepID=UPI00216AA645|nr:protein dead ringer isoform X2 [Nymphalis io]
MADADRDSDIGDDSPMIWNCGITLKKETVRCEGDSSGDQSCDSSEEGVGRDIPTNHQPQQQPIHQPHQPHHSMAHHGSLGHQMNNHQVNHTHQRNSPRPHEREQKVRDDFESLKSSLHPHLSSMASLAQGAPLSTSSNMFALTGGGGNFPYTPPAFLAPAPPPPAQPAGSASSSSSEGSAAGWSFEEQYKQLYEITDEPRRKEFLDDLFSFMQKRGTPINRLPIMAKSVLDLFELYNLVIERGGLVEVINKKLWQEIIKGLRLPSSITSAAFTLRTQYMKYLYDYECEKNNLSTRSELDAAIEGNKREGRRSSGQYEAQAALALPQLSRTPVSLTQLTQHMQPLTLSLNGAVAGVPRLPSFTPHGPQLSQQDIEYRVREYMNMIHQQRELIRNGSESPPNPPMVSPRDAAFSAFDMSRFTLWSLYNNNINRRSPPPETESEPDSEPQREALNLSESSNSSVAGMKREGCPSSPPPAKRRSPNPRSPTPSTSTSPQLTPPQLTPPRSLAQLTGNRNGVRGAVFKITTRGDSATGDQQLVVSIELNGVTYEGVLFPVQNGNGQNGHRQMVS